MASVFVSYSSKDREKAQALAAALSDFGHVVWWDHNLVGGEDYRETIDEYLSNADAIVVLVTRNSLKSRWVRDEARVGVEHNNLIPVRYARNIGPFEEFKTLHMEFLGEWDGAPRAEPIGKIVNQINAIKSRRDQEKVVRALGGSAKQVGLLTSLFDFGIGSGLRARTLLLGALVAALGIGGALTLVQLLAPSGQIHVGFRVFFLIFVALLLARGLDQLVLAGRRITSDRFFDHSFSFLVSVCGLSGMIGAIASALIQHFSSQQEVDIEGTAVMAVYLAGGLLVVSCAVRAAVVAGKSLHGRI